MLFSVKFMIEIIGAIDESLIDSLGNLRNDLIEVFLGFERDKVFFDIIAVTVGKDSKRIRSAYAHFNIKNE